MTDMLGERMDKVYSMQEQMGKISREMEILSKKKKKRRRRKAKDQKHYNRNEECL